ncbi:MULTISPECIES: S8 family peptidase [Streptomyces]|uniref:Subtilisin family serine protease n=3 Tax=Streptomyces TaxID=1883 RepID=A0A369V3X1_9ACTN|nr:MULTISPECIES: S8 family peptidase [Streptomyces]MYS47730.1 S8 family serine peptidase [Streptomyces sp. SID5998]QCB25401.1 S8 family peptidase [Streptomyces sp. SS52]QFX80232.1 S8 family serine peptidase [Streptomyces sp. SYP-A7193]WDI21474.1 S8 family peptidase [Streptomyces enissocaesilis]MCT7350655.1 S8 family peptidase [Streptomyces sp. 15-116A]
MPEPTPPARATPHLVVPWRATTLTPRSEPAGGGGPSLVRREDRHGHVAALVGGLETAERESAQLAQEIPAAFQPDGFAVRIEAAPDHLLVLERLDGSGLTLMSSHPQTDDGPQDAVVWIPFHKVASFTQRINAFTEDTDAGNPKQAPLVANMEQIRRALLEHLWQERQGLPPLDEERWWELWFDPRISPTDPVTALKALAAERQWRISERAIHVGERLVAHVATTGEELTVLLATNACPAEIRRPTFAEGLYAVDRAFRVDLVEELAERIQPADPQAPAVCILDTGIAQEHALLKPALHERAYTVLPGSTPADRTGHGTQMAGLALFGDFAAALESNGPVVLGHGLESVKILDDNHTPATSPRTCAETTANAVATAEIGNGGPIPSGRVFSMAVTRQSGHGENGVDGTATLWSATLDALAAGTDVNVRDDRIELIGAPEPDASRLIIVSAGNIRGAVPQQMRTEEGALDPLLLSDLSRIEEPAQAHNVLTVGACTHLDAVPNIPVFRGYRPLVAPGSLSPFSRTSVALTNAAVTKPDIVLEGGNLLVAPDDSYLDEHELVSVATTHHDPARQLAWTNATSAATAQAAALAATAMSAYPGLRPEAVRALLVHEAQWTPAMVEQGLFKRTGTPKLAKGEIMRQVIRRYGWGVPTAERIRSSAANAVTMIVQDALVPLKRLKGGQVRLAELKLHELPWPLEQLRELADTPVDLRVTLAYMIEPNPGRRGMLGRYSYASHGLRFAIKGPTESSDAFQRRLAEHAEHESDGLGNPKAFESDIRWLVGPRFRNLGSLHADIWRGTATELADCGALAVYPVGGWWKANKRSDRIGLPVSYALLISLRTPEVTTDLYTPIATQLGVPIEVAPAIQTETTDGIPIQMEFGW